MKIKLAILDSDVNYLSRLTSAFESKYANKIETHSFTEEEKAISGISQNKVDVLLVSENFVFDIAKIPKNCGFAYFVDSLNVNTLNDRKAICKFQKTELIYKEILKIYSEIFSGATEIKIDENTETKIITFVSAAGGTGCSTVAVACAKKMSAAGKKTLYMSMDCFDDVAVFFNCSDDNGMSEVIYTLKSKKPNIALKLEGIAKTDTDGLFYFSNTKSPLDFLELNEDDIDRFFTSIKDSGAYEYVILDVHFSFDPVIMELYRHSNIVVFVTDGTTKSNLKTQRAYESLEIYEQMKSVSLLDKAMLAYNKYDERTSQAVEGVDLEVFGGIGNYGHATANIEDYIAQSNVFNKLIK